MTCRQDGTARVLENHMKRVTILDCTLRDGGYCNDWKFGKTNIRRIVDGLTAANVDYIECGFLTNRQAYDSDRTKYTHLSQIAKLLPDLDCEKTHLVMVNYGEYEIADIPERKETMIDGIRVAFHQRDAADALFFCSQLKEKGYLVFVQPMVTPGYTEDSFTCLIRSVNVLRPYAFYIVDSFGMMKPGDLQCYLTLAEKQLHNDIALGFHLHNNSQLAFSNAMYLTDFEWSRQVIIDISIHGIGRGAGNLNAELFLPHLNHVAKKEYDLSPILELTEEVFRGFYRKKPWGYSPAYYLSALHMVHPNYAEYLSAKKEVSMKTMNEIFSQFDPQKRLEYDEKYIERLLSAYSLKDSLPDGCADGGKK